MHTFCNRLSASFAILFAAMNGAALAQNPGRGGFGPNPAAQAAAKAQTESATAQMHAYLNEIGYRMLDDRAKRVAGIQTKEQAISRRDDVRRRIVELLGGIPVTTGPVNVKLFDSFKDDGFAIENIAYESCPEYWVTANVYVPDGKGPFPAMIVAPGHGAGKSRASIRGLQTSPVRAFLCCRSTRWDKASGCSIGMTSFSRRRTDAPPFHRRGPGLRRLGRTGGTTSVCNCRIRAQLLPDRRCQEHVRGSPPNRELDAWRDDVDPGKISLYGKGGLGMVALHVAAIDERVARVILENSLLSYRTALEAGLHKNLSETVIPGVLTRYDTPQLMQAIFPRPILLINPTARSDKSSEVDWHSKHSHQHRPPTRPWASPIESSSCIEDSAIRCHLSSSILL